MATILVDIDPILAVFGFVASLYVEQWGDGSIFLWFLVMTLI